MKSVRYQFFVRAAMLGFAVLCAMSVTVSLVASLTANSSFAQENGDDPSDGAADEGAEIAVNYRDWEKKYKEVAEAIEKFKGNDLRGAMERFAAAAAKYPELPPGELVIAELFSETGQRDRAILALDTAARNFPNDPETYMLLGNLAFQENRNTEARLNYDKAVDLMQTYRGDSLRLRRLELRLNAGMASLAERFKLWEEALGYLERWVKLDSKNAMARVRYARALFRVNKGKDAFRELQAARIINPEILPTPILIAQFYMEDGNDELARQWLESAEKKYADDMNARLVLSNFYWSNGQFDAAKRHAQAAAKLDDSNANANLMAGRAAHYDHDFAAARQYLEQAHKIEPDNFSARNYLALALATDGDPESVKTAVQLAESTSKSVPTSAEALVTHAYALYKAGSKAEAASMLQRAAAARRSPNMSYIFAYFLATEGKQEQAVPFLEEALREKALFIFRRDAEKLYGQLATVPPKAE